jgi:hypothetical protein
MTPRQSIALSRIGARRYYVAYTYIGAATPAGVQWYDADGRPAGVSRTGDGYEQYDFGPASPGVKDMTTLLTDAGAAGGRVAVSGDAGTEQDRFGGEA